MTFPHNTLYYIVPNKDGSVDTRFKDGSKPISGTSLLTLDVTAFASLMNGFGNMNVGDTVTRDLASTISGPGVTKAVFSIISLSGDDAAASGWFFNGTKLTATAAVAHNGLLDIAVTDETGQTYNFPSTQWNFQAPVGSDTLAPAVPLGLNIQNGTGNYTVISDQVSDNYDGNNTPSGVKEYRVYNNANSALLSTITAPTPNKGSKLATNVVGSPTGTNTATQNRRTWTLVADGLGFYNIPVEQGVFEAAPLTGNQAVCVTLANYTSAFGFSMAGLMVRESADPGAVCVQIYLHPSNNGIRAAVKTTQGGNTTNFAQQLSLSGPINLAIERSGDIWTCLYSTDGLVWKVLGTVTQAMTTTPLWGVFACSRNPGNPITAVFTDFNLIRKPTINKVISSAVQQSIYLTSVDIAGNESSHSSVITYTPTITAGAMPWKPGVRIKIGGYASPMSVVSCKAAWDPIFGPNGTDPNGNIKGVVIHFNWSDLEGPTLGQYDGFGAEKGFTKIHALLALLKGYPIPRDLTIIINSSGNGYQPQTSTNFLPNFCPAYMSTANAGSFYGGGEVHQFNGTAETPRIIYWNMNVALRLIQLVKALFNEFGPDTNTGGVYRLDAFAEISNIEGMGGYSASALLSTWSTMMAGFRSNAPRWLLFMKPTFINPNNGGSYPALLQAMFDNHISMSQEDTSDAHIDWGAQAYLGGWPGVYTTNHTTANNGNPDWDFHCNVDPSELFHDRPSSAINNPGALSGTGRIYDMSPSYPGIWTRVNQLKASHVDVYADGYGGWNVNRRTYNASAPPNPTPGPGAGLVAAHPNIIDVLAANTSYAGVVANGCAMPWVQYPFNYPQ
jgi:hypothetical protein